ncbi:ABC transporter ATP-binding protein [bacterium]|nr:ABC transporter ATP-binding protein [bacterium]
MHSEISLENVKKTLGGREILKGISFTVERGDIFGYLGPNGAGKTTTIRILLGLFQVNSGKVQVLGQDINTDETRRKIGFVLEADGLYNNMTAEENLEYYARIYEISNIQKRIDHVLAAVGLVERARDRVGTFSKGMRQRLALARSIVHDPEVLILDEPTSGVDPSGQIELRKIMLDVAHKEKKTVFLSSHNLDEVQRICNRIALIDRGEIKRYGELENLKKEMGKGEVIIKTAAPIPESLRTELKGLTHLGLQDQKENRLIFTPQKDTEVSDIVSLLTGRGVKIEEVTRKEASLEEIYSAIVREVEQS